MNRLAAFIPVKAAAPSRKVANNDRQSRPMVLPGDAAEKGRCAGASTAQRLSLQEKCDE